MPGKLAAARASREAMERISQLPRRAGSTQGGLPTELEDASQGAESTTVSRSTGGAGRMLRKGSTDAASNGLAPSPRHTHQAHSQAHIHDAPGSGQSVTFAVSSGQHGMHGTPTATAAAVAQQILSGDVGGGFGGGGGGSAAASGPGSNGLPPRAASGTAAAAAPPASGPQTVPLGTSSGPSSATLAGASSPTPDPSRGPWTASASSLHLPAQRPSTHWPGSEGPDSGRAVATAGPASSSSAASAAGVAVPAAGAAGPASSSGLLGPAMGVAGVVASAPAAQTPAAVTAAALAAGAAACGSYSSFKQPVGAASEQVWTAAVTGNRAQSGIAGASTVRRHSRLRIAVTASEASAASLGAAAGGGAGGGCGSGSNSATTGGSLSPLHGGPRRQSGLQLQLGNVGLVVAASTAAAVAAASSPGTSEGPAPPPLEQQQQPLGNPGSEAVVAWTASAAGAFSVAGSSSAGGAPGAIGVGAGSFVSRGRAHRRMTPEGSTGFGAVSELFTPDGVRAEDPPSAESSFTVRQTPSDIEDEMLERARARRAIRSLTLASMATEPCSPDGLVPGAAAAAAAAPGPSAAARAAAAAAAVGAPAPGRVARAGTTGVLINGPAVDAAAAPPNGASRVAIRLNHQPGHQRRPPNRHASMPAMQRDGVAAGAGAVRKSPLMRPPVSGGLPEDRVPEDTEAEDAASLQYGGDDGGAGGGAAAATAGCGAGDTPSGYSRMPSDSPVTSQMSVTSSVMCAGLGSTAQQRQIAVATAPLPSAGLAAAPSAAALAPPAEADTGSASGDVSASGLALALAPAPAATSRLGAPAFPPSGVPPALMVRLPDLDSSGQRGSFEEDTARGGGTGALGGSGALQHTAAQYADRPSHMSGRLLSGTHVQTQHTNSLAALHKAVERLMLQDSGLYTKVQASMKGISSLAKETTKLEFVRDASGATVINQYVVVKTLGRGAFGKVKLCLNTLDGNLYAVKMINRAHLLRQLQKPARPLRRRAPPPRNTSDTGLMDMHHRTQTEGSLSISHTNLNSNFGNAAQAAAPARASMDDTSPLAAIMREIAVMKKVDHPHVVRLHEVIDPPGSSYLMMVMEYCEGGCVMETRAQTGLAPLGEDTAREYFRQACLGLDYLHYNNVVHGDLKPENMLVSGSGLLKIADFGSSRFMGGDPTDATKTSCTPAFQSPEEIGHLPVNPFAADLWALACCLFCFVFGRLPFVGSCVVDIYRAILTRPHTYPEGVDCSPSLRNLMDRMLDKDPKKRLMLREVGQHEWVTAGGQLPPLQFLHSGQGAEGPPPVIHVTHAEQVNAIDRSSLVSLVRARLKEKTCQPGEYLFKEGEEAHCVYMIMAGAVELTQHLRKPGGGPAGAHGHGHGSPAAGAFGGALGTAGAGHGPQGPGGAAGGGAGAGGAVELAGADHDASFSVDLDESLTLDHPDAGQITETMNIVDGKLHIDRQQAIEMRRRMQGSLLGENAEYVVEVKGPGSVIGEIGMDNVAIATHRMSARARGPVTVVKLTEENFFKALLQMYGEGGGGGSAASTTLTASSVSEAVGKGGGGGGGAGAPGLSTQHMMVMQYLEDSGSYAVFPPGPMSAAGGGAPGRFSMDAGAGPSTLGSRPGYPAYNAAHHHHHHHHHPQHPQHPQHLSSNGTAQTHLRKHSGHGGSFGSSGARRDVSPSTLQPSNAAAAAAAAKSAAAAPEAGGGAAAAGATVTPAAAAAAAAAGGSVPAGLTAVRGSGAFCAAIVPSRALGMTSPGGGGSNRGPESMMLGVLNTIHSVNASRGGAGTSEEGVADL